MGQHPRLLQRHLRRQRPLNCGHCIWCPEDQGIAWSEGFPNWLGWLIPSSYEADYGLKARNIYDFEGLTNCHLGDSYLGDPLLTEGFVAALLQDITDTTAGDSHSQFPGYPDALAVGNGPIFVCVDYDTPTSVMDFLMKFKARYAGWAEQIWQTAKNCGYEFDLMPPSVVSGLTSPSHVTTGDSPDPTIDFTWNRPTDDASGVAGYAVLVSSGGPAMPPTSMSVGNVTTYTTTTLAPARTGSTCGRSTAPAAGPWPRRRWGRSPSASPNRRTWPSGRCRAGAAWSCRAGPPTPRPAMCRCRPR